MSKFIKILLFTLCFFAVSTAAFADCPTGGTSGTLGALAGNIVQSLGNLARLITAGAYVGGFGFAVGAILKFKAHKDNPTQIPVGTPIALLFIAAALIFLPAIFGVSAQTIFASAATTGTVCGTTTF